MSIAQYFSKLALGVNSQGVLSAAKGGTGSTSGGGSSSPTISSIVYPNNDTAVSTAGGDTVTLNGTNFNTGVSVIINGTSASVVTRVSSTQITFTTPAQAVGSYIIYVVNTDGSTALAVPGLQYSLAPAWTTAAGSLGSSSINTSFSTTIATTGDTPITYSLYSGSLPSGITLNNSTGVISGTTPNIQSSTTYNFTIRATDVQNQDTDREFSITIVPLLPGQQAYTTPGTYTWTAPAAVTSICVVCVGGGGGGGNGSSGSSGAGGGGALAYANNIAVTPGANYTVVVGAAGPYGSTSPGGNSRFETLVIAGGGNSGNATTNRSLGGTVIAGTGGAGGNGGTFGGLYGVGGGGAGGYSGAGGNGTYYGSWPTAGSGGGGGGASGGSGGPGDGFGGGGVGIYGQGADGAISGKWGTAGGGGSGGTSGGAGSGGTYGGGAGYGGGAAGGGAVRIIWGPNRAFPSTNTADQ